MKHCLNLKKVNFDAIKSGKKTVEMRLFDERRKVLEIGDEIEFLCEETKETLNCKITFLVAFQDFEELYSYFDKISIGYKKEDIPSPSDMLKYYTKEQIEKYGTLAIGIKLI